MKRVIKQWENKLISEYYVNKKKKKKITVDAKTLNEFILFERMVLQRNRRGRFSICTSSMNYSFQLNGKKEIEIHDGSCDWDGYYVMVKNIFNVN
ncbi:hypothetical protein [Flavobacterium humi]|uniref:Uncharacterized protein n=1 Tax=Flavobacterium humi TaxID=2562683 RepID=A0A4Z0LDD3_9FLAO|nr:hypothetical protein [Flavobacterium humi]TGD59887.1 hypothetical protein E4635_02855 [Flavobacterium humi]